MKTIYQSYNNRTNAWIKYKIQPNKSTRIIEVKKREPTVKWVGIPVKRKK